jgi:carbamoyltransferase
MGIWTLGIHGGVNATNDGLPQATPFDCHDAAAVLCHDGEVVAAAEEERYARIKHVARFPVEAIRFCLRTAGITLEQVARVTINGNVDKVFRQHLHWAPYSAPGRQATLAEPSYLTDYVAPLLKRQFRASPRLGSLDHHHSHAISAFSLSGFDQALCVVLDGEGDEHDGRGTAGLIGTFDGERFTPLEVIGFERSLGAYYTLGTHLLGYKTHDEYKVMGLAPYGKADTFEAGFQRVVTLQEGGKFHLSLGPEGLGPMLAVVGRKTGDAFGQPQQDFAAGLQRHLERAVFHLLRHYREKTGLRKLCLAGGVAQNCSANGKVLNSGLFDEVFVQPVAYDAGCALGAALHGYHLEGGSLRSPRMTHLYLGSDTPSGTPLASELGRWQSVVEVSQQADICDAAARAMAAGAVLGWVQGRAEFGARALGNRSIVADPRPAGNRDRINGMVKKREGYRPFAPSVLEEKMHQYFEVPAHVRSLEFMVFVVPVRPEHRETLGAITHVDGTARVQSVSKESNPRYHDLIAAFEKHAGVPMVLNTSFNNNAEPIVDTVSDALNCFLSTDLDMLVVGDHLMKKKDRSAAVSLRSLVPTLLPRYVLQIRQAGETAEPSVYDTYFLRSFQLSAAAFELLRTCLAERRPFGAALTGALADELVSLWQMRVFTCHPAAA